MGAVTGALYKNRNHIASVGGPLTKASGNEWQTQDGADTLLSISKNAKDGGYRRILIDRLNLCNPATNFVRFETGRTAAKVFVDVKISGTLWQSLNSTTSNLEGNEKANSTIEAKLLDSGNC